MLEVTSTSIKIRWHEPENLNGAVIGYRVLFDHQNETHVQLNVKSDSSTSSYITYVLPNLSKFAL